MTPTPDCITRALLEALEDARQHLSWAIGRIHTLPRTSDTELEHRLRLCNVRAEAAISAAKGQGNA